MKKLTIICLFMITGFITYAGDTTWLSHTWKVCRRDTASFYSMVIQKENNWQQHIFYAKTNRIFMTGFFADATCQVKTGIFKWFNPSGSLIDSITYSDNHLRYLCHFHINGRPKTILIYNDKNMATYVNSWDIHGNESYSDTFYHDRNHNECNRDTAYLRGIITKEEDSVWHLRFYYTANNGLYINSYYKQRLCTTRIRSFERYRDGKLLDSILYYDNGRRKAVWMYHNNCMISSYQAFDIDGIQTSWISWDEEGNERIIDPNIVYPSQPGGFRKWKKRVIAQINNEGGIDPASRDSYYGNVQVKLQIDREGKLIRAYIPAASAFPLMDDLILSVCKRYDQWKPGTVRGIKTDFLLNCNFFFNAGNVTGYQQTY